MILHFPERLFLYSHSPTVNFQDISYYQSLRYNIFIRQLIILKRIKEMFNFYLLGIVVLEYNKLTIKNVKSTFFKK